MTTQSPTDTVRAILAAHPLDVVLCAIARVVEEREKKPGGDFNYNLDTTKIRKLIGELSCAGSTFPILPTAQEPK